MKINIRFSRTFSLASIFLVLFILGGCVSTNQTVNQSLLEKTKGKIFHYNKITVPCYVPWNHATYSISTMHLLTSMDRNEKKLHKDALGQIPLREIGQVLTRKYGISVAESTDMNFVTNDFNAFNAKLNDDYTCTHLESGKPFENYIEVNYNLSASRVIPGMPLKYKISYEISAYSHNQEVLRYKNIIDEFQVKIELMNPVEQIAWKELLENIPSIPKHLEENLNKK